MANRQGHYALFDARRHATMTTCTMNRDIPHHQLLGQSLCFGCTTHWDLALRAVGQIKRLKKGEETEMLPATQGCAIAARHGRGSKASDTRTGWLTPTSTWNLVKRLQPQHKPNSTQYMPTEAFRTEKQLEAQRRRRETRRKANEDPSARRRPTKVREEREAREGEGYTRGFRRTLTTTHPAA